MKAYHSKIVASIVLTLLLCYLVYNTYSLCITGMNPFFIGFFIILIVGGFFVNLKLIKILPFRNVRILLRLLILLGILASLLLVFKYSQNLKKQKAMNNFGLKNVGEAQDKKEVFNTW